jgi:hypothetical protein
MSQNLPQLRRYCLTKPPIFETSLYVNAGCNYHSVNQLQAQSHNLVSKTKSHFFQA